MTRACSLTLGAWLLAAAAALAQPPARAAPDYRGTGVVLLVIVVERLPAGR